MTYELKETSVGIEPDFQMICAYSTLDGSYIGLEGEAKKLEARGIVPQGRTPTSIVASIGFCEREQKWYGWSHRAMFGFGIGHTVKPGDVGFEARGEWTAKTLEDARQMACDFAEGVS